MTAHMNVKNVDLQCFQMFQYATPSERNSSIKLIEVILDTIAESVSTFKPSQSLAAISQQHDERTRASDNLHGQDESGYDSDCSGSMKSMPTAVAEIDLVISGGGFKGYFMCGAAHVLTKELAKRNMRINRIAGTSAGGWAGLFICCGFTASHWMETYYACKDRPNGTIHEVYTDLVRELENSLQTTELMILFGCSILSYITPLS